MEESGEVNVKKYRKTLLASLFLPIINGLCFSMILTNSKIKTLKLGDYPDMPQYLIDQQYNEALPSVIRNAIFMFLGFFLFLYIISISIDFKVKHEINIFKAAINWLKGKRSSR